MARFFSARAVRRFACTITAASLLLGAQPALAAAPDDDEWTAIDPMQGSNIVAAASSSKALQGKIFGPNDFAPSDHHVAPYVFKLVDPSTGKALAVDPSTGKLLHPDQMITNPAGYKVKASDYWNSTNTVETLVNKQGHSLHEGLSNYSIGRLKNSFQSEIASTVKITDVPDTAILPKGGSSAKQAEGALPSPTPPPYNSNMPAGTPPPFNGTVTTVSTIGTPEPPPNTLPAGYKGEQRTPAPHLPADVPNPTFKSLAFDKKGNWSGGDPNIASMSITPYIHAEPKDGNLDVSTGVDLDGYIFGAGPIDIASVSLTADPPQASANVMVMGAQVYHPTGYPLHGDQTLTLPINSVNSALNPSSEGFSFTLTAGAAGSIGISYEIAEDRTGSDGPILSGGFTPFVSLTGSIGAQLSVNTPLPGTNASVSVDASLTIAQASLPFALSMYYRMQTSHNGTGNTDHNIYACEAHFMYALTSEMDYTFLKGNVSLNISVCVVYQCNVYLTAILANYDGFSGKISLAHLIGDAQASDVYSDLPEYGFPMPKTGGPFAFSHDDSTGKPAACSAMQHKLDIKTLQT